MDSAKSHLVIGYLSAIGRMASDTASASCTQALQGAIPDFQLSVARSLLQSVVYVSGGMLFGTDLKFKRETFPGLLYLGFLYLLLNVGYYGATTYLPLTETYGVLVIASIVTAFIHSRLIFYIEITKSKVISLFVCVVGITLAAQPSWLFNKLARTSESALENISYPMHSVNVSSQYVNEVSNGEILLGYILSMMGGAALGLMFDANGIILKGITPIVKITYAAIFCMIGSVAFMLYMEGPVLKVDLTQFLLVLGHGVLSASGSFLFVQSSHYIPGPTLSAVYSFQMVLYIISQYTIMHSIQPGNYNWIEVVGCMIIIFGACISPLVDILVHRAQSDKVP